MSPGQTFRRSWWALLIPALVAALLAGCGSSGSSADSGVVPRTMPPVGVRTFAHPTCGRPSYAYPVGSSPIVFNDLDVGWLGEQIWSMDATGRRVRLVTFTPRCRDIGPAWSPDGRWLAFESDRAPGKGNSDIYLLDGHGRHLHDLTPDPDPDSDPAWSPSGEEIAFLRPNPRACHPSPKPEPGVIVTCGDANAESVMVVDVNSGRVRTVGYTGSTTGERPTWSRDGRWILDWNGTKEGLYLIRADGHGSRLLKRGRFANPAFSPDSKRIAAACSPRDPLGLSTSICVMRSDGSGLRAITPVRGTMSVVADFDPAWSPSGRRVLFARCNGQTQSIWLANADGTNAKRLHSTRIGGCADEADSRPSWRP